MVRRHALELGFADAVGSEFVHDGAQRGRLPSRRRAVRQGVGHAPGLVDAPRRERRSQARLVALLDGPEGLPRSRVREEVQPFGSQGFVAGERFQRVQGGTSRLLVHGTGRGRACEQAPPCLEPGRGGNPRLGALEPLPELAPEGFRPSGDGREIVLLEALEEGRLAGTEHVPRQDVDPAGVTQGRVLEGLEEEIRGDRLSGLDARAKAVDGRMGGHRICGPQFQNRLVGRAAVEEARLAPHGLIRGGHFLDGLAELLDGLTTCHLVGPGVRDDGKAEAEKGQRRTGFPAARTGEKLASVLPQDLREGGAVVGQGGDPKVLEPPHTQPDEREMRDEKRSLGGVRGAFEELPQDGSRLLVAAGLPQGDRPPALEVADESFEEGVARRGGAGIVPQQPDREVEQRDRRLRVAG